MASWKLILDNQSSFVRAISGQQGEILASITKLQGMWRVRIRHNGVAQISKMFSRKGDATKWPTKMGHKDLKMIQRYTHLREEDLAKKLR